MHEQGWAGALLCAALLAVSMADGTDSGTTIDEEVAPDGAGVMVPAEPAPTSSPVEPVSGGGQ